MMGSGQSIREFFYGLFLRLLRQLFIIHSVVSLQCLFFELRHRLLGGDHEKQERQSLLSYMLRGDRRALGVEEHTMEEDLNIGSITVLYNFGYLNAMQRLEIMPTKQNNRCCHPSRIVYTSGLEGSLLLLILLKPMPHAARKARTEADMPRYYKRSVFSLNCRASELTKVLLIA